MIAENGFYFLCKLSSQNQDTPLGPSSLPSYITEMQTHQQNNFYHAPPLNQNSLGAGVMQLNYPQQQAMELANVATERCFSPGFQSPSSYRLYSRVFGSEFSRQGSAEFQQLNFPSSVQDGNFQLPSPRIPGSNNIYGAGSSSQSNNIHGADSSSGSNNIHGTSSSSYRINYIPGENIDSNYNEKFPTISSGQTEENIINYFLK